MSRDGIHFCCSVVRHHGARYDNVDRHAGIQVCEVVQHPGAHRAAVMPRDGFQLNGVAKQLGVRCDCIEHHLK